MDGVHQYDSKGRAITTWDKKKCSWIVNPEFEDDNIDWYGEHSDFPAGYTLKEYKENFPDWDKKPDIVVTWTWKDKASAIAAFGQPHTFGESSDYWDKKEFPMTATREWGYIDEPEETTVERFGKYCNWHIHASNVRVLYNGKEIFNGKLS